MKFTESVRSRQVPLTPLTSAWPPRRPSVPTSRATRVTSSANAESWSTIVLMVFLSSRISPRAGTSIFCERSPLATAVATWAMSRTWVVRLPAIALTESVRSAQVPETPGTSACPPSVPSVPTSRATRVTSEVNTDSWSTMPLKTVAMSPRRPPPSSGSRVPKSPSRTAVRPASSRRSSGSPGVRPAGSVVWLVMPTLVPFIKSPVNVDSELQAHCRTPRHRRGPAVRGRPMRKYAAG